MPQIELQSAREVETSVEDLPGVQTQHSARRVGRPSISGTRPRGENGSAGQLPMYFKEMKYREECSVRDGERSTIYRAKGLYVTELTGVLWVDEKQFPK